MRRGTGRLLDACGDPARRDTPPRRRRPSGTVVRGGQADRSRRDGCNGGALGPWTPPNRSQTYQSALVLGNPRTRRSGPAGGVDKQPATSVSSAGSALPLLLVALDDVGRPGCRSGGVLAGVPPALPLVEQVVGLVELDLDLVEPFTLIRPEAAPVGRPAPELFFLVREGVDPVEEVRVVSHCPAP